MMDHKKDYVDGTKSCAKRGNVDSCLPRMSSVLVVSR